MLTLRSLLKGASYHSVAFLLSLFQLLTPQQAGAQDKGYFYSYFKLNFFRFHVWSADQHIPEISLLIIFTLIVPAHLSLPPPASAADFCTSYQTSLCVVLPLFHTLFLEEGESQSKSFFSALINGTRDPTAKNVK